MPYCKGKNLKIWNFEKKKKKRKKDRLKEFVNVSSNAITCYKLQTTMTKTPNFVIPALQNIVKINQNFQDGNV